MTDHELIIGILDAYRNEIRTKSPKSYSIWQKNRSVMPAGVGSLYRLADPFPMVIKKAQGARIWDVDENEYLDCMFGFSTMILGNTPDEVEAAIPHLAADQGPATARPWHLALQGGDARERSLWCEDHTMPLFRSPRIRA